MNLICCFLLIARLLVSFLYHDIDKEKLDSCKKSLIQEFQLHQAETVLGAKKTDLEITDKGFIRYKRTGFDGKIDYYSFKAENLERVDYLGTEDAGWMVLKCKAETIIFQTYNDKNGNEDEMVDQIKIPLKRTDVKSLNVIDLNLQQIKDIFSSKN
ncbi:hypothetical protein I5M32_02460 [Pedobacter sp. SD-b]|uniref:Uncharacterized protein n=1 Tax=Pedobacter segetis TaxID=2793069 RepID=A0ABS1BG25_9SPHI|nr:hypothetical protein [Pedobacter segetis]MBK0381811.1 hypothetical protein [Pedobacter segetis]